jgi:GntR family transcriptional regulator, rspAB operon transcriptional repressor
MKEVEQMNKANKSETAYKMIKDLIIQGKLTNDINISENILVKKLKMSRTPIRAALQRLQLERYIKIVPNQGIFIRGMSIAEAREKYDLRIALELYVIKKVIRLLSTTDFENLQRILRRQLDACQNDDADSFIQADIEFHMYFLKMYNNKMIFDIINDLRDNFYFVALQALKRPSQMTNSAKEHHIIFEALKKNNINKALKTLEMNIEKGILRTMQTL